MHSRTKKRVERWDSAPFSGGYGRLRALAAADFSGAITVDGAWLFLLNGRVVGTLDGSLEDFETGAGTRYVAPHPSLPLFCVMYERGGETKGTYHTNDTSLEAVDRTLRERSFTGYVELSENVVSGDYYAVYYGGQRLALAYVGGSERLLTGDEAFDRAIDEVGIYSVVAADVDVAEVPDAPDPTESSADEPAVSASAASSGENLAEPRPPTESAGTRGESEGPSPDGDEPAADEELEQRFEGEARWREASRTPSIDGDSAAFESAPGESRAEMSEQREQLGRNALRARLDELEAERDRLGSTNEELSTTVDRLRSRVRELEAALEQAEAEEENAPKTERSRAEALSGTNLFVRYGSRSLPTLEAAHDGHDEREDVVSNRRLEYHTQFDETDVVVDRMPYAEALADTMEYRFVDWLTGDLLFEVRDTGRADGLGELYDAIPRIDRIELQTSIDIDDDTSNVPDRAEFDVVAYDKMGCPLVVANLNDSREPASETMLYEMEEAASALKAHYPALAAAIVVTSSYFEPDALEVVERATGGGFLSRGSRLSYVNLSRKQGYHLCLAESRSGGFHMTVPEL
jgi:hypothetical protein